MLLFGNDAFTQLESSAFTSTGSGYSVTAVTDYHCLGINPANLGWKRNAHNWNLGISEVGMSIYSEVLPKEKVMKDMLGKAEKFATAQARQDAIENFTDKSLIASASVTLFGISFQREDIGGISFAIKERLHWHSNFNKQAAQFLFLGYKDPYFTIKTDTVTGKEYGVAENPKSISELYNPTIFDHIFYQEYVLGYGRQVLDKDNLKIFAGFDLKYLQGYGILHVDVESSTTATGYQALSPFYKIDYGDNETPSEVKGDGLKKVGSGFGVDLGLTFLIQEKFKFSLAVNDIGSINWDGNVYEGRNPDIMYMESDGVDSYNIFEEAGDIMSDNTNVGSWDGLKNKKVGLATNLRAGASYKLDEQWEFGGDFYYALKDDVPGAFKQPLFGLGTRYDPAKWIQLSLGFTAGGQMGWDIPMGVTFRALNNENTTWEIGFATRDMVSLFAQKDPTISVCFGFLRFSFGHEEGEARFLDE